MIRHLIEGGLCLGVVVAGLVILLAKGNRGIDRRIGGGK
jgi:hypothetical protein